MKCSLVRRVANAAVLLFFFLWADSYAASNYTSNMAGGNTLTTPSSADEMSNFSGFEGVDMKQVLSGLDASADSYEYVGDNIIARGHVVIRSPELQLIADNAIINISTRDVEASGNVTFTRMRTVEQYADLEEYRELLNDVRKRVEVTGYATLPSGRRKVKVKVSETTAYMRAERIAANLNTGAVKFKNFALKSGMLYTAASEAERAPNGTIRVKNARLTTCDYIMDDHDHYALTASSAIIKPRSFDSGLRNYNPDQSDHSVFAVNPVVRFWDVPLLWFPVLYKPMETDSFGVDIALGSSSDWGFWVRTNKSFTLYDDPFVNAALMVDYYSERGVAGGVSTSIVTGNSRTELFAYGLHDRKPYQSWDITDSKTEDWYKNSLRLDIPKNRYDFKLNNLTHITPRLDFRGQLEFLSDVNFLEDYFDARYQRDIQPPTYAALEYQFDRASLSVLTTVRANKFDSVTERLPEAKLDIQRQELFAGLYYQSESSAGYLYNKWRTFDSPGIFGDLSDYKSGRFDTLQMFYYPLMLDFLNVVPRAGVRFTGYTATSKNKVTDDDLMAMFRNNGVEAGLTGLVPFQNFQESHNAKLRVMGEIGMEVNTKIYRSWQDVRSAWLGIDGLRHVFIPYLNYTYIPKPTLDPEEILYFDDIDRLKEQNFVRIGAINRLQTRTGNYGSEGIQEWASLETYWDFHAVRQDGFNNIGDLGMRFSLTPFTGLSLTSEILMDVGHNNDHDTQAERAKGRQAGYPGLMGLHFINKWNTTLNYEISKDWSVYASYIYSDQYYMRSVYSMGSMIDNLNSTSTSLKVLYPTSQKVNLGLKFPTYIDPKLKGEVFVSYDVEAALLKNAGLRFWRNFHCFDVGVEMGKDTTLDEDGDKDNSYYVGGYVTLSALPSASFASRGGN